MAEETIIVMNDFLGSNQRKYIPSKYTRSMAEAYTSIIPSGFLALVLTTYLQARDQFGKRNFLYYFFSKATLQEKMSVHE